MNDIILSNRFFYSSKSYYACFLIHSKNNLNVPLKHMPDKTIKLHEYIWTSLRPIRGPDRNAGSYTV